MLACCYCVGMVSMVSMTSLSCFKVDLDLHLRSDSTEMAKKFFVLVP